MIYKKNVLYIIDPSKDITGAFICARNEARLLEKDFEIVLVLPTVTKIEPTECAAFAKVVKLPIYDMRKSFFNMLIYFPALFLSGWKLNRMMAKDQCTLLQVNDYYLMQGVVARLFGYRGRLVTWVRIDPTRYGAFFSKYWLKYMYWASDSVVAVSRFIESKLPISKKNRVLYDPVNETDISVDKEKNVGKCKIIYIANYTEGKGQQYAIEAFSKIAGDFKDVELHFYGGLLGLGKNRKYKESLQEYAAHLPCAKRIVFHGFEKETYRILEKSCLALNFSESESFSLTCLEASQNGISVIATRSGGPEEIIKDGYTGYLVDKGDIEGMSKAMRILLKDGRKREHFGQNGSIYVREKFSDKVFQKQIKEIFTGETQ